ncbi:MAG: hypothetical protein K2W92_05240 [Alphaproteobacteria bacterium]|nr:hypothetical protein [Alphaproteobacteria bacterium]
MKKRSLYSVSTFIFLSTSSLSSFAETFPKKGEFSFENEHKRTTLAPKTLKKDVETAIELVRKKILNKEEINYKEIADIRTSPSENKRAPYGVLSNIFDFMSHNTQTNSSEVELLSHSLDQLAVAGITKSYGFERFSKQERWEILNDLAKGGSKKAQWEINHALLWGRRGQDKTRLRDRLKTLRDQIRQGDQDALEEVTIGSLAALTRSINAEKGYSLPRWLDQLWFCAAFGHTGAREAIIQHINENTYVQVAKDPEGHYQDLKRHAKKGNKFAQKLAAEAVFQGELAQGKKSPQQRFNELIELKDMGNKKAFDYMCLVLAKGLLGQSSTSMLEQTKKFEMFIIENANRFSVRDDILSEIVDTRVLPEKRFAYLKMLAKKGVKTAEKRVVKALAEGKFGQEKRPSHERFNELVKLADEGSQIAKSQVVEFLYFGKLLVKRVSADERYERLMAYINLNNPKEKEWLSYIHKWGALGIASVPQSGEQFLIKAGSRLSDELFLSLKSEQAEKGNEEAKNWLNQIIYKGTHGYGAQTPQERFKLLQIRAQNGCQFAEKYMIRALILGSLGQSERSPEERFKDLEKLSIHQQSVRAQKYMAWAVSKGKLGQENRSHQERFFSLDEEAKRGNKYAEDAMAVALLYGSLGQWNRSGDERFAALDVLASSGNEKAQKIIVGLLSDGVEGEFYQEAEIRIKRKEFFAQDLKSEQEKLEALEQRAQRGNNFARQYVMKVAGEDHFIFDGSSRLEKLLHWAALGDKDAFGYLEKGVDINSSQNNGLQLLKLLVFLRETMAEMK